MVVSIHYKKLCVLIKFAVVLLKGNSYRIYFWVMIKDEAMDWIKKDDFILKRWYKYKEYKEQLTIHTNRQTIHLN